MKGATTWPCFLDFHFGSVFLEPLFQQALFGSVWCNYNVVMPERLFERFDFPKKVGMQSARVKVASSPHACSDDIHIVKAAVQLDCVHAHM